MCLESVVLSAQGCDVAAAGGAAVGDRVVGTPRPAAPPGPASGRPVSPPPVLQVAASSIDSGGCCSAQVTAASSTSASARSASLRRARANASTAVAVSRSGPVVCIGDFNHRPLAVPVENSLVWWGILEKVQQVFGRTGGPGREEAGSNGFETLAALAPQPPGVAPMGGRCAGWALGEVASERRGALEDQAGNRAKVRATWAAKRLTEGPDGAPHTPGASHHESIGGFETIVSLAPQPPGPGRVPQSAVMAL
ncbi:MAG: hypothetical protein JWR85_499 [Marmoricola sp.]|nr:hypothetical protein [Marmoricola sp.]